MVLDFAKEMVEKEYPGIKRNKDLKELLKKWGYKIDGLDHIEISTCNSEHELLIRLGYTLGVKDE